MRRLLAALALTYAVFFVFGFVMAETIKISTRVERGDPNFYVTVTLTDVVKDTRWLSVHGCYAEIDSENRVYCDVYWERESTQETRADQRQYVFPWRPVPRGKILITAAAFNQDGKVLASGRSVVIR